MPHTCVPVIKVENLNEPTKLGWFPIKPNAAKSQERKLANKEKKRNQLDFGTRQWKYRVLEIRLFISDSVYCQV